MYLLVRFIIAAQRPHLVCRIIRPLRKNQPPWGHIFKTNFDPKKNAQPQVAAAASADGARRQCTGRTDKERQQKGMLLVQTLRQTRHTRVCDEPKVG